MGSSPKPPKTPETDYKKDILSYIGGLQEGFPSIYELESEYRPKWQDLNLFDVSKFGLGAMGLAPQFTQGAAEQLGAARESELGQMTGQAGLTRGLMEGLSPEQAAQVASMQDLASQAAGAEGAYAGRMGEALGMYGIRPQEFGTTITESNLAPTVTQRGLLGETVTQGGLLSPTIQAAEQDAAMANQMAQEAYARRGTLSSQEQRSAQQTAREAAQSAGRLGGNAAIAAEIQNREAALAGRRAQASQAGQQAFEQRQNLANLRAAEQQALFGQQVGARQLRSAEEQALFGQRIGAREQALQQEQALFGQQATGAQQRMAEQQGLFGQRVGGAQATAEMQQAGLGQLQDIEKMRMGLRGLAGDEAMRAYQAAGGFYTAPGLQLFGSQPLSYQSGQQMMGLGLEAIGSGRPQMIDIGTPFNLGAAERQNQFQAAQSKYASDVATRNANTQAAASTAAAIGMAALTFSDKRVKKDIEKIGKTDGGLPIYTFKYKGEDKTKMGVMAQDVEKKQPKAVATAPSGIKMVNYSKIK
jgi:hypothetical protein